MSFSYDKQFRIHFFCGTNVCVGWHFGQDIVGVVADLIDVKTVNPPYRMTVRLRDNRYSNVLISNIYPPKGTKINNCSFSLLFYMINRLATTNMVIVIVW